MKPQVKLFTPGPLNTSQTVKEAMIYDYGSRDPDFGNIVENIKTRLLRIAKVPSDLYAAVLVQGSGSFAVEATMATAFPRDKEYTKNKKMLIASNGAYGERMVKICVYTNIPHDVITFKDNEPVDPNIISAKIANDPTISHVSLVHSETTAGLLNPIEDIGKAIHETNPDVQYIVDTMSSFGGVPIDMQKSYIDYLVSSSNKMLQGVPGIAYAICKIYRLKDTKGNARSLCLDLYDQWDYQLLNPGQFRFTPPTHVLAAFDQAMNEFEAEGGVEARSARYFGNQKLLSEKMRELGFELYVDPKHQGACLTTFLEPDHPNYDFKKFYNYLTDREFVIYPGKLSQYPTFRLGNIGEIYESDILALIENIKGAFEELKIDLPLTKRSR